MSLLLTRTTKLTNYYIRHFIAGHVAPDFFKTWEMEHVVRRRGHWLHWEIHNFIYNYGYDSLYIDDLQINFGSIARWLSQGS